MSTEITLDQSVKLLKEYSCIQVKTVNSESDKEKLRQAILTVVNLSEYENIGVCAENVTEGVAALLSYLKAFGYKFNLEADSLPEIIGAVYIKFNTKKMSYYLDSYVSGSYRGVLVSCFGDNEDIVGTYGHFPLDLFTEVGAS